MITDEITQELFRLQDKKYREFQIKLIPSVDPETVIGVRTPALRSYAKELAKREDIPDFLHSLPHRYFDENQLHAFIISGIRDYAACMEEVCRFRPFTDNWATCDQMSPKVFRKHKKELIGQIKQWLASGETYTVRFAVGMLMEHFLDEDFTSAFPEMVSAVRSEEYYVNMMRAWYFATALAKQYDAVLPFLENRRLDAWTHNKAIQKAAESFRVSDEHKEYLKTLKIKTARKEKDT